MTHAFARAQDAVIPDVCRFMVDASPLPMAFLSGESHTIRYVNPVFRGLVGETGPEPVGDSFTRAVSASGACQSMLDRVYRTGRAEIYPGEERFSSRPLHFSYAVWPVNAESGDRIGLMIQVTESTPFHDETVAMNEALILNSVRQHELAESAQMLNAQLRTEILHRKLAEEESILQAREIKASEQRYRGLIEAIPQIVWTATPAGILDFANPKWFEHLNIDLDTFNRVGWAALVHPDDRDSTLQTWASHMTSGSAFEIEHRLTNNSNGNFRWFLTRAVPIQISDGRVWKWLGTSTDVEDQKRAEMLVFNKQRLESLGLLAGGIAHDFNNLLCAILGGASLVADALPPSHHLQPVLVGMTRASERAAHLTRQMLAYSGKGSFFVERLNINDLIGSTCDAIKGMIPRYVVLTMRLAADIPDVEADSGQMQQVVMNLILNAAEAISDPFAGYVTVSTELMELTAATIEGIPLVTGTLRPGSYVVVQVQDNGSGMTNTTLVRIFDPFYTTKFTGRGLGLSAVEGILRSQKGALAVHTAVEKGSTFRVYLPASTEKKPAGSVPVGPIQRPGTGAILVVDDEEMVRRVIQLGLEKEGFAVLSADSGKEAVRVLQTTTAPIALVILDLSMPGMSGKQVLRKMRALRIDLPVLVASGYGEEESIREFVGLDIAGFIQKPFTAGQLTDRVRTIFKPFPAA